MLGLKIPTLTRVKNFFLGSTAGKVNDNFDKLGNEFDKVFYRDGSLTATGNWDINSQRLYNLLDAKLGHEPATLNQLRAAQIAAGATIGDLALRNDLADPAQGASLVAYAVGQTLRQKIDSIKVTSALPVVNFAEARGANESDKDCFNRLSADLTIKRIYFPDGQGKWPGDNIAPAGSYRIGCGPWQLPLPPDGSPISAYTEGRGNLRSDLELFGDGEGKSIIYQEEDNYIFQCNSLSEDPANNIKNVWIHGLTLRGKIENYTSGLNQVTHIISLQGASNVIIERNLIKGFVSDGVYAAMGPKPTTVRHNDGIFIRHNTFDGVNKKNRNAISFEDTVNALIQGNRFINLNDPGHGTGAIDIEPINRDSYRNGNVIVDGNFFDNIGGAAMVYNVNGPSYYTYNQGPYFFINNQCSNMGHGVNFSGDNMAGLQNPSGNRHNIFVRGNTFRNISDFVFQILGMYGVDIDDNHVNGGDAIALGFFNDGRGNREVRIRRNIFANIGLKNGVSIFHDQDSIGPCEISDNWFIENGRRDKLGTSTIFYARQASNVGTRLINNLVRNEGGYTKIFARNESSGTVLPIAAKFGNVLYDVPMVTPDTYNPAPPPGGVRNTITLSSVSIAPNTTYNFDVPAAGADSKRAYKAFLDRTSDQFDKYQINAYFLFDQTVRVNVANVGANTIQIANGTKLILSEDV